VLEAFKTSTGLPGSSLAHIVTGRLYEDVVGGIWSFVAISRHDEFIRTLATFIPVTGFNPNLLPLVKL
jgi:hypothetical protein